MTLVTPIPRVSVAPPRVRSGPCPIALAALALLSAIGCASEGPATSGSLETLDVAGAEILPSIERDVWNVAPAGCEGRLADAVRFGVAEGEPELVVALDENDSALCVDTYAALESELTESGLMDEADRLWLGYLATLQNPEFGGAGSRRSLSHHDPVPQPNIVADQDGVNALDDPGAQLNTEDDLLPDGPPDDGVPSIEPTPQPNGGTHDAAGQAGEALSGGTLAPAVSATGLQTS